MSRGPGYVQRAILELIAGNPDGAWTTSQICAHIYRDKGYLALKKHRVAVTRALRKMKLPPPWRAGWSESQRCIYNAISEKSIARRHYVGSTWGPSWGRSFEEWFRKVHEQCVRGDRVEGWLFAYRKEVEENRRAAA